MMKKHCGCTRQNPVPENHGQDLDDETQRQVAHDLATLPTRVYGRKPRGSGVARRNPTRGRRLLWVSTDGSDDDDEITVLSVFREELMAEAQREPDVESRAATINVDWRLGHVYVVLWEPDGSSTTFQGHVGPRKQIKFTHSDTGLGISDALDRHAAVIDWLVALALRPPAKLPGGNLYEVRDFPEHATRINPITPSTPGMLNERWVDGLLRDPSHPQWTRRRAWRTADIKVDGQTQRLTVKRDAETHASMNTTICLWYLGPKESPVAAGVAYTDGDAIRLSATAVRVHARRRGVYRAVIVALRKLFGVPIESDDSMAEGAIRAWQAAGAVETKRRGTTVMRINPRRSGR